MFLSLASLSRAEHPETPALMRISVRIHRPASLTIMIIATELFAKDQFNGKHLEI